MPHVNCLVFHSDMAGDNMPYQEQYLEQIVSYLRAFKSSCLAEVSSREEHDHYMKIWGMLHSSLMWCLGSHLTGANDVEETGETV